MLAVADRRIIIVIMCKQHRIFNFIIFGILFSLFCFTAQEAKSQQMSQMPSERRISLALELAYADFSRIIASEFTGDGDRRLLEFLSSIDNYRISIEENSDSFVIRFTPLAYPGGEIRGGGAEYVVTKDPLVVENIELFE